MNVGKMTKEMLGRDYTIRDDAWRRKYKAYGR